jgi:hypothetical protein
MVCVPAAHNYLDPLFQATLFKVKEFLEDGKLTTDQLDQLPTDLKNRVQQIKIPPR